MHASRHRISANIPLGRSSIDVLLSADNDLFDLFNLLEVGNPRDNRVLFLALVAVSPLVDLRHAIYYTYNLRPIKKMLRGIDKWCSLTKTNLYGRTRPEKFIKK